MIKLSHLNKHFNKGKTNEIHVLNDITIDLPNKGLVVFLGESGSGKTTLLNVIGGLDKIGSGNIYFADKEISKYNVTKLDELRNETIGYIFQNYYLQPQLSVFDNVAFVLKMIGIADEEEIKNRVNYVLTALGMFEFRKKKALQLSGGQQQRVAIARALVKNPNIIIADEPTGNLDSKNTSDIMNIIKEIAEEKLVLLVTHDRELAKFYANRIIEIVDGKIVDDYDNMHSEYHGLDDDQIIYLKDLKNEDNLKGNNLNVNLYSDTEELEPVKVELIYKNNTLYLNVDSKIKNIKLANDQDGLKILDEHYVKKSREELLETSFDKDYLNHEDVPKQKKFVVSSKRNLKLALGKVLSFGRKGKLMIASFILAGMVIAFALSMLFTAITIDPVTPYPKDTIRANIRPTAEENDVFSDVYSYAEFNNLIKDDNFVIREFRDYLSIGFRTFDYATINLDLPIFGPSIISKQGTINIVNDNDTTKLVAGRNITNNNEILISKQIANQILNNEQAFFGSANHSGNDYGIWSYSDILREEYSINIFAEELNVKNVKIVGIANNDNEIIYMNSSLYEQLILTNPSFDSMEDAYNNATSINIFSSDKEVLLNSISSSFTTSDIYNEALEEQREANKEALPVILPLVSVFLGFTVIGFYFVIRSSMISRIQEIGIYRALGVKRVEILSMFFFEIVVLTTISTLVGYILGTILVNSLSNSLLGQLNLFTINSFSIITGFILVYAINILAGLLPVVLLVRKTPAQILTQYDI